ncbi:FIST C-terminal domain-containing protein [Paraglaciecola sp.]|uniref:FIST signal transduction protein n=1 Tax=Paraglaciecola sp. TaxID=1920173 RepID=UPI00326556D2
MGLLFGQYQYSVIVTGESLQSLINAALSSSPQALLIFCCDESLKNQTFVDPILTSLQVPVFGGVFPAIIIKDEVIDEGLLVVPIFSDVKVMLLTNLENADSSDFDMLSDSSHFESAMILIDGISRNIDFALNSMFEHFGNKLNVFGGGAGSLSFERKPCLFSNQGLLMDAMVVIFMPTLFELAIGHGWEVLDGPFLANEVDDNKIIQLNFQPAFEVYEDVIDKFENKSFTANEFFEVAKTYPFGIERLDDDVLVRDPISVEENSLVCVGKVPENTLLYILKGDNKKLVAAAVNAVEEATQATVKEQGLLFDCVSRHLFLENEFKDELKGITSAFNNSALLGVLVLGEIASSASGAIHFHNKTAVTAVAKHPVKTI